jgi:L-fuculose-phosphate aldolase
MRNKEKELRRQIAKVCRALYEKNLVAATDGNISARLDAHRVLVTPSGISKGDVGEREIAVCDMAGRKVGRCGEISSEINVHLAAYNARPDVGGVVHAHPPIATAFTFIGAAGMFAEPVIPEVANQIGPIPAAPYITPGTRELAEAFGSRVRECDLVLLIRHGAVAVGKDPWAAYLRMEKLEHTALILKAACEMAGGWRKIKRLSPRQIEHLRTHYGKGKSWRSR